MKTILFLSFLAFGCIAINAQSFVTGKVVDESNLPVNDVLVVDLSDDSKVTTDRNGEFKMHVTPKSVLRFVVRFLKRKDVAMASVDLKQPLTVVLEPEPIAIAPVVLGFRPSLNIKKDAKALDESVKLAQFKKGMRDYMRSPMTEVVPKLTTPSSFGGLDYKTGTVSLKGVVQALGTILGKVSGNEKTTANFAEREEFLRRMLDNIDMDFLRKYDMDEYEIETYLSIADDRLELSKRYRKNFNKSAIEMELKGMLENYLRTTKRKK